MEFFKLKEVTVKKQIFLGVVVLSIFSLTLQSRVNYSNQGNKYVGHIFKGSLKNALMKNSTFDFAQFVRLDMEGANLDHSVCNACNFSGAHMKNLQFNNGSAPNAQFLYGGKRRARREKKRKPALLSGAQMTSSDFSDAQFMGAVLKKANLQNSNLSFADLTGAYVGGADFRGANLWGAKLKHLRGHKRMKFDEQTLLPDGGYYKASMGNNPPLGNPVPRGWPGGSYRQTCKGCDYSSSKKVLSCSHCLIPNPNYGYGRDRHRFKWVRPNKLHVAPGVRVSNKYGKLVIKGISPFFHY